MLIVPKFYILILAKTLEENSSWGNKFIDNVAIELKMSFPNLKGFLVRNLKYMKSFITNIKMMKNLCNWLHNYL